MSESLFKRNTISRTKLENRLKRNSSIWLCEDEDEVYIKYDFNIKIPSDFEFTEGTYPVGPRKTYRVKDCWIIGRRGAVFDQNHSLILESVGSNFERFFNRRRFLLNGYYTRTTANMISDSTYKEPIINREYDEVFPLISIYHQGYYFWLLEYLPKLRGLEQYSQKRDSTPPILVQPNPPKYMIESLALAGYGQTDIIEWHGQCSFVNSIILSQHRIRKFSGKGPQGFDYNPSIKDIEWVRKRLTRNIKRGGYDRIYISRQNAKRGRKISNYESLEDKLSKRGFQSVCLEKLPFEKQVEICANADVIIGPHGAGLTNMIFSTNAKIFEIFNDKFLKPSYCLLAHECGHDYYHYIGDTADEVNIRVDIEEFLKLIDNNL
ncbi:glycosyltransferase family 61 protein [Natrialbaceae archaeon A-CW2]